MTTKELQKKNRTYPLLSCGTDAKTVKGEKLSVMTGILYLAPHKAAGVGNFCANASPECIFLCLYTAGRAGIFPDVNKGRMRKTLFFVQDRKGFDARLYKDIRNLIKRAERANMQPAVRLDGTSDIGIATQVCEDFPEVMFYDYTKNVVRMARFLKGRFPRNYHLTFSRSETNDSQSEVFLRKGAGVAMLFETMPKTYKGFKVINGDESDLRYLDRKIFGLSDTEGYVIALSPKGRAKKSFGGMVIREV
jgi:hypothetical protein